MREIAKVNAADAAALAAWLVSVRALAGELRNLSLDATARKGQRKHARSYLREQTRRRLRALELHLDALDTAPIAPAGGES